MNFVNNFGMKAVVCVLFIVGSIAIFAFAGISGLGARTGGHNERDFLRIHIRAHSNEHSDQMVKYHVRQRVVDELTPIFYNVTGRYDAMNRLSRNLGKIENIATDELRTRGFKYGAAAAVTSEFFPTRSYTVSGVNLVLPEGTYDALILKLGAGLGDNWWSVIYPPLCFLGNNIGGHAGVRYRSRILDFFR